jgi:hypothetical protein
MQTTPAPTPGPYVNGGLATLLRYNEQQYLWSPGQSLTAGSGQTSASIAVQLERIARTFYPWGAAFEVGFSGAPGSFEVDIQFAEIDTNASFVTVGTITAVNASNVGRYDMPNTVFPKYVRGICKTLTNPVTAYLLATH